MTRPRPGLCLPFDTIKLGGVLLLTIFACQRATSDAPSRVHIDVLAPHTEGLADAATASRIVITVTAEDMPTVILVADANGTVDADIPSGSQRQFDVTATDDSTPPVALYWGRTTLDMPSAASIAVSLNAFSAGTLLGKAIATDGTAVPEAVAVTARAVAPRVDAPARVITDLIVGEVIQPLPTGTYELTGAYQQQGKTYALDTFVTITTGRTTTAVLQFATAAAPANPNLVLDPNGTIINPNTRHVPLPATKLAFSVAPLSVVAGTPFDVLVDFLDASGNPGLADQATVSLALHAPNGAVLQGPMTAQSSNGSATFSGLSIAMAGAGYTLTAASPNMTSVTSGVFDVQPGSAATLQVVGVPGNTSDVQPFSPTVTLLDAAGNVATQYTGTLHFSSSASSASLPNDYTFQSGDLGTKAFTLSLASPGPQSLTIADTQDSNLTFTTLVQISTSAMTGFAIGNVNSTMTAGQSVSPRITAVDAAGNLVSSYTGTIHLAVVGDANAIVPQDYTYQASDFGVTTLPGLTFFAAGTHLLNVKDTHHPTFQGNFNITVTAGAAVTLQFASALQPNAIACQPLSPPPTVLVLDAYGNASTSQTSITLSGPALGPVLQGNTTLVATGGTAAFDQVRVAAGASAYHLTASASGLASALSSQVNVVQLPPTVSNISTSGGSGDVLVSFMVADTCSSPVSVRPFYQNMLPVSLAPGAGGLVNLTSTPTGVQHTFNWNTWRDFGASSVADVPLLLQPQTSAVIGAVVAGPMLNIDNALNANTFAPVISSPLASPWSAIAVGDVNEDGIADMVGVSSAAGTMEVAFLTSDGHANMGASLALGLGPADIVLADINSDGHLDAVVALAGAMSVVTALGAGDGTFGAVTTLPGASQAFQNVAVADVTVDGHPDILAVASDSNQLFVGPGPLLNGFTLAPVGGGGNALSQLVVGDFDRNGQWDAATGEVDGALFVFFNSGLGLNSAVQYSGALAPSSLVAADINHDGFLDLLESGSSALIAVLDGNSLGFTGPNFVTAPSPVSNLVVTDADGDGWLDMFASAATGLIGWRNQGAGMYAVFSSVGTAAVNAFASTDFNHDGLPDIIGTANGGHIVAALPNTQHLSAALPAAAERGFHLDEAAAALRVADFNHDGIPDVLAQNTDVTYTLLGRGDGTYGIGQVITDFSAPTGPSLADFNQDGFVDLALVQSQASTVAVYLGDANGNFAGVTTVVSGGGAPSQTAVGDINFDTFPDLIVVNGDANALVYLGDGQGGLTAGEALPLGGVAFNVRLGDIDNDGNPDLVAAVPSSNIVSYWLGTGTGTFQNANTMTSAAGCVTVAIADFNNDAIPDVVCAGNNQLALHLGSGAGGFNAPTFMSLLPSMARLGPSAAMAVGQFVGDPNVDVVVFGNALYVLKGLGNGYFSMQFGSPAPGLIKDIASCDIDNDGTDELVMALQSGDVMTMMSQHNGGFYAPTQVSTILNTQFVLKGDVNGDGTDDVVSVGSDVETFLVDMQGTLSAAPETLVGMAPVGAVLQTVDADNFPDLVTADSNGTLLLLTGYGDGTFAAPLATTLSHPPAGLGVADFNNDGNVDAVVTIPTDPSVTVVIGGDGFFGITPTAAINPPTGPLVAADFTHDAKMDVAVATAGGIDVYSGVGDGNLLLLVSLAAPAAPDALAAADINHDGYLDIVASFSAAEKIIVYLGAPLGTFPVVSPYAFGAFAGPLTIADLNSDGLLDVVSTNSSTVGYVLGAPDGTFTHPGVLNVGVNTTTAAVADFNHDGRNDVVAASSQGFIEVMMSTW